MQRTRIERPKPRRERRLDAPSEEAFVRAAAAVARTRDLARQLDERVAEIDDVLRIGRR